MIEKSGGTYLEELEYMAMGCRINFASTHETGNIKNKTMLAN